MHNNDDIYKILTKHIGITISAFHPLNAAAIVWQNGADGNWIGIGGADPFDIAILFMKNRKLKAVGFGADHHNLTREFLLGEIATLVGFLPNPKRKRHGGLELTFLTQSALEMYAGTFVRKLKFNRHRKEGTVARVAGVPTVGVLLSGLPEKRHVTGTAKGIVGNPDSFGGNLGDFLLGTLGLFRNGNRLSSNRCGKGVGKPVLVPDGRGTKIGIKDDSGSLSGGKGIGKQFFTGVRLGGDGGGVRELAVPSGRRAIGKRNDGFFDDSGEKSEHSEVRGGKLSGIIVVIRVVHHGLDELRLGGGVDHQGLDGLNIKEGFRRVRKGGVRSTDIKGVVHIPIAAGTAALKGCGPIAEISGRVEQVAGDSARPALRAGDGRNKRTERNRFHFTKY